MYKNTFQKCLRKLTDADIDATEKAIGIRFPQALREHYLAYNGGVPDRKCWSRGEGWDPDCIKLFFPIRPMGASKEEFKNTLADVMAALSEELPEGFIPFADDWGGNPFCMDADTGGVYFYTMDSGDTKDDKKKYLTSSLSGFIEGLIEEPDYLKPRL